MHGRVKVRRTEEQERLQAEKAKQVSEEFRSILRRLDSARSEQEHSDAALALTKSAVEIAPDTYKVWNFRREILTSMLNDPEIDKSQLLNGDIDLTTQCLGKHPKSYAVWFHRLWVMDRLPSPNWQSEREFCSSMLVKDERNFHCWDYRRSVISRGKISTDLELAYTDSAIEKNFSNYSAWHYRSQLIESCAPAALLPPLSPPPRVDCTDSTSSACSLKSGLYQYELDLIHNAIFTDPSDQSPWLYYWWFLGHGTRKVYIRELYLSRNLGRLVLVFSSVKQFPAVKQLQVCLEVTYKGSSSPIKLTADDLGGWQSVFTGGSALWWLPISEDMILSCLPEDHDASLSSKFQLNARVCIPLHEGSETQRCQNDYCNENHLFCLSCTLEEDQTESLTRVNLDPLRLLNPVISPVHEPSSLTTELSIIQELLQMEPKNKWALLTRVNFLRFFNLPNSKEEIDDALSTLRQIDPDRLPYYEHLKNQHRVQDALISVFQSHLRQLDLQNLGMKTILYPDWCALITSINLSNNKIRKLPSSIAYLICLSDLNLDDNEIETLRGIQKLPSLLLLSVQRNKLDTFEAIDDLLHCPVLQSVSLHGNDVTSLSNFTTKMTEHPSSKCKRHSFSVIYDNSTVQY